MTRPVFLVLFLQSEVTESYGVAARLIRLDCAEVKSEPPKFYFRPARPTISRIPSSCGNSASRVNLIRRAQNGFAFDFFFKRDGKSFCLTSDELIRAYHTGLIQ